MANKVIANTEDLMQSYLFFLRLNIRTFVALLDVFQEALDGLELGKVTNASVDSKILSQRITPIMARILPVLRLYSLWLRKNSTVLAQGLDSSFATIQEGMWTAYARCLSSIIQVFPSEHLSSLEYLLKEDEDTLGFKPLHCQENSEVWNVNDIIKPRWHEISGKTRDANAEMLSRITGLVVVALKLAMDPVREVQSFPLFVANRFFRFRLLCSTRLLMLSATNLRLALPLRPRTSRRRSQILCR